MPPTLTTFKDLIDHLLDYMGGEADPRNVRRATQAVLAGYQEFCVSHQWSYFYTTGLLATVAPQTEGTIEYDHCLTPEHEALTRDGWKTYDQLRVGDEILAYDHDAGICEWQPVEKIHVYDYDGDVLEVVRDGHVALRCTPNHRIPVLERFGKNRRGYKRKYIKAKNLKKDHRTPLAAPIAREQENLTDSRMAGLIGWVVTDGSGGFKENAPAYIYQSHEVNLGKCKEIEELVGRPASKGLSKPTMSTFSLKPEDKHVIQYILRKQGLVPTFARFAVQEAEAAFRAMIMAEAGTNPKNNQKVFAQWGKNYRVAEAFQVACLLSGKATNIRQRTYPQGVRHQCTVRKSQTINLSKGSEWKPYSGKVWCPQVKSGGWIVRCNGYVMATGNSGGAFERMVELTDSTWPDWVRYGTILIDNVPYRVSEQQTSTVIQLSVNGNPGEDVSAGTEYTLYRDTYPLPTDFVAADRFFSMGSQTIAPWHVHPRAWLEPQRISAQPSTPCRYALAFDENYFGAMAVLFQPPPDQAYTFNYIYQRTGRPLRVAEYLTGTVSNSSGTDVLTGSGTSWNSNHVGCVVRLSDSATQKPTGLAGLGGVVADEERTVIGVESATSIVVDEVFDNAHSGVKYSLSDPVDVEPIAMRTALLREIERQARLINRMKPNPGEDESWRMAQLVAREADSRSLAVRVAGITGDWAMRLRDYPRAETDFAEP